VRRPLKVCYEKRSIGNDAISLLDTYLFCMVEEEVAPSFDPNFILFYILEFYVLGPICTDIHMGEMEVIIEVFFHCHSAGTLIKSCGSL